MKLTRAAQLIPDTRIVLDPAEDAPHDFVMKTLDACRQADILTVAFRAPPARTP
jgi:hypothetical protein